MHDRRFMVRRQVVMILVAVLFSSLVGLSAGTASSPIPYAVSFPRSALAESQVFVHVLIRRDTPHAQINLQIRSVGPWTIKRRVNVEQGKGDIAIRFLTPRFAGPLTLFITIHRGRQILWRARGDIEVMVKAVTTSTTTTPTTTTTAPVITTTTTPTTTTTTSTTTTSTTTTTMSTPTTTTTTPSPNAPEPTTLLVGQSLHQGQALWSSDGQYEAVMQADGNFVVYSSSGVAQWSTATQSPGAWLVMQSDGNLVVYSATNSALWSTGTVPGSGDSLIMQTDGNLVLYSKGGVALWSSRGGLTGAEASSLHAGQSLHQGQALWSSDGQYEAVMQADGNFVVYSSSGVAQWSTATQSPGAWLVMQSDGNLVVYSATNSALWSSGTAPSSGDSLDMQTDGNLVIYDSAGRALWAKGQLLSGGLTFTGYPYNSAVDCSAQFGVYSWCINNWWISPLGYGYRNCTDYAAWWLESHGVAASHLLNLGNAETWASRAAGDGDTVVSTAAVGDVAYWSDSSFGHVAIVTAVNADGSVNVAEYNYAGTGNFDTRSNVRATSYIAFPGAP